MLNRFIEIFFEFEFPILTKFLQNTSNNELFRS